MKNNNQMAMSWSTLHKKMQARCAEHGMVCAAHRGGTTMQAHTTHPPAAGRGIRPKHLPSASHLAALHLLGADDQVLATIENKPGQTGSLVVYAALAALYGGRITPAAATLGLEWYAEHVADARTFPGKHPNIDRLLAWAQGSEIFGVRTVLA